MCYPNDNYPCTVIRVTKSSIFLREDRVARVSGGTQLFLPDRNGKEYRATLRKDGDYRIVGTSMRVTIGERRFYQAREI